LFVPAAARDVDGFPAGYPENWTVFQSDYKQTLAAIKRDLSTC